MLDLTAIQKVNLKWFEDNLQDFIKNPEYKNNWLVIHNKQVLGAFKDSPKALDFAIKKFGENLNQCIIQEVIDNKEFMHIVNVHLMQHP